MKGWEIKILGTDVSHKKGNAFNSAWFKSAGKPIVKVTNFTDNSISSSGIEYVDDSIYSENIEFILHTNDVVVQTVGSWPNNPASVVGKVVRVPKELDGSLLNQNAVILKPKANINRIFFYYLLKSDSYKGYIINTAQGAANQASITLDSIFRYSFFLPHLPIQRKIAAVLSAYDDLIENNNRRIAILEKMAEELYREWFVRLRFPGYEKVKVVNGVPEGWEVKKLSEIIELAYGKALKDEDRLEGPFPVYGSSGIIGYHNSALVKRPGIIVGRKGNVGNVIWSNHDFFPIDTVYYVRSKLPFEFLYFLIKGMNFINNDAAVPGLNREQAYSNKLYLPKIPLIKGFVDIVTPIYENRFALLKKTSLLTTSRDRLLSRLMSGKIDVENLDIRFPISMKEEEVAAHA